MNVDIPLMSLRLIVDIFTVLEWIFLLSVVLMVLNTYA